jgi:hypothetical protein
MASVNGYSRTDPSSFPDLPSFPDNVSSAPLLSINLDKLLAHDKEEEDRMWKACCELGFFYIDLRPNQGCDTSNRVSRNGDQVCGRGLLRDAEYLFKAQKTFFSLPVEQKQKYDFAAKGSYFGYKGYGSGVIDKEGTTDRNEFYNVNTLIHQYLH